MAICLALGADAAACALPFLKAASDGVEGVRRVMAQVIETLRIIHFVCGARSPGELRGRCSRVTS